MFNRALARCLTFNICELAGLGRNGRAFDQAIIVQHPYQEVEHPESSGTRQSSSASLRRLRKHMTNHTRE